MVRFYKVAICLALGFSRLASATPVTPCERLLQAPQPQAVVLDFERKAILFAVPADQATDWPATTAPVAGDPVLTDDSSNSLALSKAHSQTQIAKAAPDAKWIDVTASFNPLATQVFERVGPLFADDCPLDDLNCHGLTSTLHFDQVSIRLRAGSLENQGLIEIHPSERRRADIGAVFEIDSQEGFWRGSFHSFSILKGTDWAIHKTAGGATLVGAEPLADVLAPYLKHNPANTVIRYFVRPENYRADMAGPPDWAKQIQAIGDANREILHRLMPLRNVFDPAQNTWFNPFVRDVNDVADDHDPLAAQTRLLFRFYHYKGEIFEFTLGQKKIKTWFEDFSNDGSAPLIEIFALENPAQGQELFASLQDTFMLYQLLDQKRIYDRADLRIARPEGLGPWEANGTRGEIVNDNGRLVLKISPLPELQDRDFNVKLRNLFLLMWNYGVHLAR